MRLFTYLLCSIWQNVLRTNVCFQRRPLQRPTNCTHDYWSSLMRRQLRDTGLLKWTRSPFTPDASRKTAVSEKLLTLEISLCKYNRSRARFNHRTPHEVEDDKLIQSEFNFVWTEGDDAGGATSRSQCLSRWCLPLHYALRTAVSCNINTSPLVPEGSLQSMPPWELAVTLDVSVKASLRWMKCSGSHTLNRTSSPVKDKEGRQQSELYSGV